MEHVLTQSDHSTLAALARSLFQGARTQSTDSFQDWALEQVKSFVAFDSAKWVTGAVQDNAGVVHTIHLHGLPEECKSEYAKYQHQDRLLAKLIATRGGIRTFSMYDAISREDFVKTDLYTKYCRIYGEEQLISTAIPEPDTNLFSVISFYRRSYAHAFTEQDKQAKTMLSAVLAEARSLNIFANLFRLERRPGIASAVSDRKGILREAETEFSHLMKKQWPQWHGPALDVVPETLVNGAGQVQFQGDQIVIDMSVQHDLVLLEARAKSPLDMLTRGEQQVAGHLTEGLTNKEIAKALGISPRTVGNHLHRIYAKLDVPNRQRAIAMFKAQA